MSTIGELIPVAIEHIGRFLGSDRAELLAKPLFEDLMALHCAAVEYQKLRDALPRTPDGTTIYPGLSLWTTCDENPVVVEYFERAHRRREWVIVTSRGRRPVSECYGSQDAMLKARGTEAGR